MEHPLGFYMYQGWLKICEDVYSTVQYNNNNQLSVIYVSDISTQCITKILNWINAKGPFRQPFKAMWYHTLDSFFIKTTSDDITRRLRYPSYVFTIMGN